MKILFIDDDLTSVKPAMQKLRDNGFFCEATGFAHQEQTLNTYRPDLVILDMMEGRPSDDPTGDAGMKCFRSIWDVHFCPIVVYTANTALMPATHPLIAKVSKGRDSDENVLTETKKFKPIAESIESINIEINRTLRSTLRDVAPYVYECKDIENPEQTIRYLGRRRVAAQLDNASSQEKLLHPIEQYIIPPISTSVRLGDLIRNATSDATSPESYSIVLTPSCDLVNENGRKPKVERVLCAHCQSNDVFWQKGGVKKDKGSLNPHLSAGFRGCYYFIPGIPNQIPTMVADLRDLELIPYDSIVNHQDTEKDMTGKYLKVAEIDSPFRENIAWAYLNTGCRPGLPDRDLQIWAKQLLS